MRPVEPSDVSPADADSLRVCLRQATDVVDPSWPDFEDLQRTAVRRRRRTSLATAASVLAVTAFAVAMPAGTSPTAHRPLDFATQDATPVTTPTANTPSAASPPATETSAATRTRATTAADAAAQQAAYMRGLDTFRDYLKTWEEDGAKVAADRYLEPEYRLPAGVPGPTLRSGQVIDFHPVSWTSPGRFTLALDLDLHFVGAAAWGDGSDTRFTRFVTFEKQPGPVEFLMTIATGP